MSNKFLDTFDIRLYQHLLFDHLNAKKTKLFFELENENLFVSYILTSHEWSCEQNGQGKTTERARIRFCFGGAFRFDFRFPIFLNLEQNRSLFLFERNKTMNKKKSFYFLLFFVFTFVSGLTWIGFAWSSSFICLNSALRDVNSSLQTKHWRTTGVSGF